MESIWDWDIWERLGGDYRSLSHVFSRGKCPSQAFIAVGEKTRDSLSPVSISLPMLPFLPLTGLLFGLTSAMRITCRNYHRFTIDGGEKVITMTTNQMCSGFKYCVYAVYEDVDPMKKQGFTMGCDKTDCAESISWEVWDYGRRCKYDTDYGSGGYVCCCDSNLCNDFPARKFRWDIILPSLVVVILIVFLLSAVILCMGRQKGQKSSIASHSHVPSRHPSLYSDVDAEHHHHLHDLIDLNDIE